MFETPKQAEKIIFWFRETKQKTTVTDWVSILFGSNRKYFLFVWHPNAYYPCLDLEASDVSNGKAEDTAQGHEEPEVGAGLVFKAGNDGQLPEDQHQGEEENTRVHIVVKGQGPDVVLKRRLFHWLSHKLPYIGT